MVVGDGRAPAFRRVGAGRAVSPSASAFETLRTWGRMVKFSHSVFALPFALTGAALAAGRYGIT